ncbi:MAG: DNA-directed RNA polymerase subunit beta' [Atopostipes sp.]|nr:DNA-directed RNA polymerase subunit beta' [Atopostipes sp.]
MIDVNKFNHVQISIASPDKIRQWSHGEVKKPETINYRTLKAEKDGLFCERIFGPMKDYECACGKYRKVHSKGIVCDRCGVEVTKSKVRRERMGHIELAAPVTHIWFFKGIPSRLGLILDMSPRSLEEIIYYASYVVIEPGNTPLEKKQLLNEFEYRDYRIEYGNEFKAEIGADAVKLLLNDVDLDEEVEDLKDFLQTATGQKRTRAIRRLDIMDSFASSGNKLEWMIMDVLPVIPPELRPMVQLDGGRFATADLNDLYRRVINRNNRLKNLLDLNAPHIIVQNEKRMLQESVDALVDNGRRGRPVTGPGNRPLKSLSHMLKGKQGRFRQNLLGKRVDYSGRSVIVVGPELKMHQCGLPKKMAVELFKPFVMRELVDREIATNVKNAKRKIEQYDDEIWDVLEDVIQEHPVLLNRAPTLHRLGIQAFQPVLIDGKAIQLHPLACEAYNADFDGDQMAVHVPLSEEAKAEARILMLGAQNILNPKDGKPVVTPSQDMVLGNYYLTLERPGALGEGMTFSSADEVVQAYQTGYVHLHSRIAIQAKDLTDKSFTEEQKEQYLITTVGKIILNGIMPKEFPYLNEPSIKNLEVKTPDNYFVPYGTDIKKHIEGLRTVGPFKKNDLGNIIAEVFKNYHVNETSRMLDEMKNLGYKYATKSGITVGLTDVPILKEKEEILDEKSAQVDRVNATHRRGLISEDERYQTVIEIWTEARDVIQDHLETSVDEANNIHMMSDSGARGTISNFTQLAGMRGLIAGPSGQIMELPITSNFREGLSVLEMFISTHGARKGMTDTALKTADSGYLTRRLVDVSQDVIVREDDCGTESGFFAKKLMNGNEEVESLEERILGRYAQQSVLHPETEEVLVKKDDIITENIAKEIVQAGIKRVSIRSVYNCNTRHGVCRKCYGRNLATGRDVEVGESVGIVAAQSIGEPGTQLTMRTFHTGGVAGDDITQGLPRVQEIFEARHPKGQATISEVAGVVESIEDKPEDNEKVVTVKGVTDTRSYKLSRNARMRVEQGDRVERGDPFNEGSIDPKNLLAVSGVVKLQEYLLKEVQYAYRSQGVEIGDKHIEVIVRQMMRKVRILDPGDTDILPGELIDIHDFQDLVKKTLEYGGQPATARSVLLGITKAALETNSFLSAASFQETTRVLTDAVIRGKQDNLIGLKENVIIGKQIPAGTGLDIYKNIEPKSVGIKAEKEDLEAINELKE